jgi:Matrixin
MPLGRSLRAHAGVAAIVSAAVWPASASAFCRSVTSSPPAGYDPTVSGCYGFAADGGVSSGLFPLFWRNKCVSYSFEPHDSKYVTLAQAKSIAATAFEAWSSASCPGGGTPSISAILYPDVDCDDAPSSGHNNVIIFRDSVWPYDDASNTLGFTTLTVDLTTGEILGADTEINSAQWHIVPEPPAPENAYDFATIMTHEAGHFLGLAHTTDKSAVMFASYHPATLLQPDDVTAICSTYEPNGTHSALFGSLAAPSCDATPLAGFLPNSCGSFDGGIEGLQAIGSGAVSNGELRTCPPYDACSTGRSAGRRAMPWGAVAAMGGLFGGAALMRMARRPTRRRGKAPTGSRSA